MTRTSAAFVSLVVVGAVLAPPAYAQSEQQSIALKKGWNLVWLSVQPEPDDPATVLGGVAWEGIWSLATGAAPGEPGVWLSCVKGQPAFVNTLEHLKAERGYLIRTSAAGTLEVRGTPVKRTGMFAANTSTLFGLHLPPGPGPTFSDYFSFAGAGGKILSIYKLTGNVFSPVSPLSAIESDVSYWITFSRDVNYAGPFRVNAPAGGYQFGKRGYSDRITVEVQAASSAQTLSIKAVPAAVPAPGKPADAGAGDAGWLQYAVITPGTTSEREKREWKPLTGGATIIIPSGQTRGELEIRADRRGRAPATVEWTSSLYQALIQVTDARSNSRTFAAGMEVAPHYGVYIGQARLNRVLTQTAVQNPPVEADATPLPAALILSLPGPEGGPMQLLHEKSYTTVRDGRKRRQQYSAALFHKPVTLTGTITGNGAGGTLTGTLEMTADDPVNPYRHRYNPEHRTGYAFTRQITITFSPNDEDAANQLMGIAESAGNNQLTGTYTEVITGMSQEPITVSGPFRLTRLTGTTDWTPKAP